MYVIRHDHNKRNRGPAINARGNLRHSLRADQRQAQTDRGHHAQDRWRDDFVDGRDDLFGCVDTQMKDWAVSFIAAALLCGLVVWCAKVFVEVLL